MEKDFQLLYKAYLELRKELDILNTEEESDL